MGKIYPREILPRMESFFGTDEIVVVLGARQVGKSSLLLYLQELFRREGKDTYFIDLEDIEIRKEIVSPSGLLSYLKMKGYKSGRKAYVFLDELHHLEDATGILKFLHDHHPGLKFFVSGSSSLRLRLRMRESLMGRKIVFILYPLRFPEFLLFREERELLGILREHGLKGITEPFLGRLLSLYEEYLIWGGYPKVVLTENVEIRRERLKEIFTTYMEKEVYEFIKREKAGRFSDLVSFLGAQSANLYKTLEVSKEMGMQRPTVERYVKILEETFVVKRLYPFATNLQKELTRTPKLYFLDTGFLNFAIRDFRPLRLRQSPGIFVETGVFVSLLFSLPSHADIRFWRKRGGREVDFVIRMDGNIIPVEVKWKDNPRIPGALIEFMDLYKSPCGFLFTSGTYGVETYKNKKIYILPAMTTSLVEWRRFIA